ncbi:hypothetical protein V6O07_14435, partial [Arthrospira platensis SPKY2]
MWDMNAGRWSFRVSWLDPFGHRTFSKPGPYMYHVGARNKARDVDGRVVWKHGIPLYYAAQ